MISSRVMIHKACSKYLATSVGFWFLNCCFLAIFVAEHFWQDHAYLGPLFTTLCFRQITGEIGIQEARHRSQSCKFLWLLAPRKRRVTGDWWIRGLSSKRRAHSPSKVVWGSLSDQINILAVKPMARCCVPTPVCLYAYIIFDPLIFGMDSKPVKKVTLRWRD